MSRATINLILDSLLLVVFCVLVWTSTVVRFVFPRAAHAAGWRLWGLEYDGWLTIQFATLALLALGVLIHVMLHWNWVCGTVAARLFRSKKGRVNESVQTIYGVGLLIVLLNVVGLALAAAALTIQEAG